MPRFYAGFNPLVVGLVGMISFITVVMILITDKIGNIKIPLSALVVYGAAWIYQALAFARGAGKKIVGGPADAKT